MFFHILKRDLKRKKTMNLILLIFIVLASMFLASSTSNLITVTGAVDKFMEVSKVPEFFTISILNQENDPIEEFIKKSIYVDEYEVVNMFNLMNENISIKRNVSGTKDEKKAAEDKYERSSTISICPLPDNFMKVFDLSGEQLVLENGEIALPEAEADKSKLQVGDSLVVNFEKVTKEFKIKTLVKDAVFGSSMMGFKRLYITEKDFNDLADQENIYYTKLYNVNSNHLKEFETEFKKQDFQVIVHANQDLVRMCYVFDMLISGILIIVSICLILIAFLILRFTIQFTLQEDYKEIGIMKAIGMKNAAIKNIYLVKYLAISVIGSAIGFLLSFPFEKLLLEKVVVNILLDEEDAKIGVNVICALSIVVVVLLFCYISTSRLKKFSAMAAIRNGSKGETYKNKNLFSLHNRKGMVPAVYMACNDVVSNYKKFVVLAVIFCIGTMLILLPLSAVHTLKSDELVRTFSISPSDAYIDNDRTEKYMVASDKKLLESDLEELENTLKDHGLESKARAELTYMIPAYSNNPKESFSYATSQSVGYGGKDYEILEGRYPELKNEILITEKTAKEMDVAIGDSIFLKSSDQIQEFVITGMYQSMINMGNGFRVNEEAELDYNYIASLLGIQLDVSGKMDKAELYQKLQDIFPEYKILTAQEFIGNMIGDVMMQLDKMLFFIAAVVFLINSLITVLMMKTLMTKERGEIAMLKSIGFNNRSIKIWQSVRILLVLVFAILLGILLSEILAPLLVGAVFAMMGANHMRLIIEPLEYYVIYPLLLLIVTGISAFLCSAEVENVDLKEVNNME